MSIIISIFIIIASIFDGIFDHISPPFFSELLREKLFYGVLYIALTISICYESYRANIAFNSKKMIGLGIIYPILLGSLIEWWRQEYFPPMFYKWEDWGDYIIGILFSAFTIGTLIGYAIAKRIIPTFFKPETEDPQHK